MARYVNALNDSDGVYSRCFQAPSQDEICFVLEILDKIAAPVLDKIEVLLESTAVWDSVAHNDFCR